MNIRQTTKRLAISTIAATALLAAAFAPSAFAADDTSVTVTGGSFSITNPLAGDFLGRSITGAAQTTTASLATFSVSDLTGAGAGWTVTAQATPFEDDADALNVLDVGSLSMSLPTVTSPDTESPDPTVEAAPYVIDTGASAVLIATADVNEGMGTYVFSATTLTLALPADVFAGTYTSTVTVSAAATP